MLVLEILLARCNQSVLLFDHTFKSLIIGKKKGLPKAEKKPEHSRIMKKYPP